MLVAVALLAVLFTAQPREPFRVHVYASPRGEPELVEAIERAANELANAVRDEKTWFHYVEQPEQAEILVYVEALSITDFAERSGSTSRMGNVSHTTNFPFPGEDFELQALTEFLGRTEILQGRSGTSESRAASALFGELEAYVKEHYRALEKRRILFRYWAEHPEHIDYARAVCDEVGRASSELELPVVSVRWSGSTLIVARPRTTSRFPFTSARLETCIPDAPCRREIVNQVIATLGR